MLSLRAWFSFAFNIFFAPTVRIAALGHGEAVQGLRAENGLGSAREKLVRHSRAAVRALSCLFFGGFAFCENRVENPVLFW